MEVAGCADWCLNRLVMACIVVPSQLTQQETHKNLLNVIGEFGFGNGDEH